MRKATMPVVLLVVVVVAVSACVQLPKGGGGACAQVITSALSPDGGQCEDFPTPCDVPSGWKTVPSCPEPCPKGEACH